MCEAARSPDGRFVSGEHYSQETEFKPGERRSRATEYKQGQDAHNKLPVGSVRIRRESYTGRLIAWVKTAEPNVWRKRCRVVWESVHGPIPRGIIIHHVDRDPTNDSLDNLMALTRRQHADEHRDDLNEAKRCS